MKLTSYIFVGLTLAAGLCASCSGNKKGKDGRTDTYSSGAISFVSDESFSPIIEEERAVFQFDYPQAKVTPVYTNESEAINRLPDGKSWLAFAARNFKDSELKNLQSRNYRPIAIKVAYDALAFIVNKDSKDTIMSVLDIKNVMNGTAKRWRDISNGSSNGLITVVFDNAKSSTVHYVEDSILGGKPIVNPHVVAVNKTAEVIKYVEQNPGAIGVIGNNWLNDKHDSTNLTFNKNIRDEGKQSPSGLRPVVVVCHTSITYTMANTRLCVPFMLCSMIHVKVCHGDLPISLRGRKGSVSS